MCLKLFLVILRHFSNVSNVPLGGRVESQIVPLRDALTSELHSCVSAFDFFLVFVYEYVCLGYYNTW